MTTTTNSRIQQILANGPSRIVTVVRHGHVYQAMPQHRTTIRPEIVLVRDDGWSLGCLAEHEDAATRTWGGCWTHRIDLRTGETREV